MTSRHSLAGFSLAEMAITLLIITLLTSGALMALRVQTERSRFTQTQAALLEAKQALLAFAATQGRLPCPADPAQMSASSGKYFGQERVADYTAATLVPSCAGTNQGRGLLPWKTLGIQGVDAWDQYLSYEVSPALTSSTLTLQTEGSIAVRDSYAGTVSADKAVAFAIWSQGANGNGAVTVQSTVKAASTNTDELANAPVNFKAPQQVILRTQTDSFDDTGLSVSRYVLFKQMIDAGIAIPRS